MTPADGLTLRPADEAALDGIADVLAANDLPHQGLDASPGQFVAGYAGGDLVCGGGVELYGADAMLRSVVVAEPHRSQGYGAALCERLEALASEAGATDGYLLTTTAADFFEAHGYEAVPREAVPDDVLESPLVAAHCPASATCMHRSLDE